MWTTTTRRTRRQVLGLLLAAAMATTLTVTIDADRAEGQPAGDAPIADAGDRLQQVLGTLKDAKAPGAPAEAVDRVLDTLYGGARVLPTPGVPDSQDADDAIRELEEEAVRALQEFAEKNRGDTAGAEDARAAALDAKLFIEQMNEVAGAVAQQLQQQNCPDPGAQPQCPQPGELLPVPLPLFDPGGDTESIVVEPGSANDGCGAIQHATPGAGIVLEFGNPAQLFGLLPPPIVVDDPVWMLLPMPVLHTTTQLLCPPQPGLAGVELLTQTIVLDPRAPGVFAND